MRKLTLFSLFACLTLLAGAQTVHEKIYLQTDRDFYKAGETIYFKGVVLSAMDSAISTALFVEIWDDSLHKVAGSVFPVIEGSGSGSITIPGTSSGSSFLLRAYTEISGTQAAPFQFVKPLFKQPDTGSETAPVIYPEGGNLVYGATNYLVFQSAPGLTGVLRNSTGDSIQLLLPGSNGMGNFSFRPQTGERYYVQWMSTEKTMQTPLPEPVNAGSAVHLRQTPDTLFFELDNGLNQDPGLKQLKVQLLIADEIAYQVELKMNTRSSFSYFIPLTDFHTAPAAFRVLDATGKAIANRPLFISRNSLQTGNAIQPLQLALKKRTENQLRLQLADTLIKVVTVSITDADRATTAARLPVFGVAAARSPFSGQVPEGGFSSPEELDTWVQLNAAASAQTVIDTKKAGRYRGGYLRLTGTVKKGKKLLTEKKLLVGVRSDYTGKEIYKVITDKNGRFELDGLIAYGNTYVHCRLPGNEQEELTCSFTLTGPEAEPVPAFLQQFLEMAGNSLRNAGTTKAATKTETADSMDALVFAENAITLEEVQLRSNSKLAADKRKAAVEEKYVNPTPFAGYTATGEMVDVLNDPTSIRFLDIFSYIRARMNRVNVRYIGGQREIMYYGRGLTGEMPVTLFYIDNTVADRSQLESLDMYQVAAIKFVPNIALQQDLPPALGVFLRKPGDKGYWENDKYQTFEHQLTGYPVYKEFILPDYGDKEVNVVKDNRITLFWDPYVSVQQGTALIRFYNTDITRRIRVVVEAISADGSIQHVEKLLE